MLKMFVILISLPLRNTVVFFLNWLSFADTSALGTAGGSK